MTIKIRTLFVLFCTSIFYTCKKDPGCSNHQLTPSEESFTPNRPWNNEYFKNDKTGNIDTLFMYSRNLLHACIDCPCKHAYSAVYEDFRFSAIDSTYITIGSRHNAPPSVEFITQWPSTKTSGSFYLTGSAQTITINGIIYNDAYTSAIDSNSFTNPGSPWKIEYSKSKGLIRFYMKNGITWSKL